jgi:PAS domain-containing protein
MPHGLCMFDRQHRLMVWNKRFCDVYRIAPEALAPGITLRKVIEFSVARGNHPDRTAAEMVAEYEARLAAGVPSHSKLQLPSGRIIAISHQPDSFAVDWYFRVGASPDSCNAAKSGRFNPPRRWRARSDSGSRCRSIRNLRRFCISRETEALQQIRTVFAFRLKSRPNLRAPSAPEALRRLAGGFKGSCSIFRRHSDGRLDFRQTASRSSSQYR